ncbi:hypothetical protein V5O48_002623 [Marasmius crinis-equi]|uniref:No apical meristem-associated C-terminal domain-containing protein n=1 Tax=Marasmius crinis-equi TaxID=585013 RepID=A0ABR3FVN5_9AGAR
MSDADGLHLLCNTAIQDQNHVQYTPSSATKPQTPGHEAHYHSAFQLPIPYPLTPETPGHDNLYGRTHGQPVLTPSRSPLIHHPAAPSSSQFSTPSRGTTTYEFNGHSQPYYTAPFAATLGFEEMWNSPAGSSDWTSLFPSASGTGSQAASLKKPAPEKENDASKVVQTSCVGSKCSQGPEKQTENADKSSRKKLKSHDQPVKPLEKPAKKPSSQTKPKKKGTGAKSGAANRRDTGLSDDEIEVLSTEDKAAAQLRPLQLELSDDDDSDDDGAGKKSRGLETKDKERLVEYITKEEVWKDFKLKQRAVFQKILDEKILSRRDYTLDQLTAYWHGQAWDKYKAVREWLRHTGGGDGDEARTHEQMKTESEKKRKRASTKRTYSSDSLEKFYYSNIYTLIDARAHDDEDVVREREYNSANPVSDNEEESASRSKKKARKSEDSDRRADSDNVELAEIFRVIGTSMKDKREIDLLRFQSEEADRKERREREAADRKERQQQEAKQRRTEQWKIAMEFAAHTNPLMRERGERMLKELAQQEEQMESIV